MLTRKFVVAACAALVAIAANGEGQTTPAPASASPAATEAAAIDGGTPAFIKAETPQERQTRIGTPDDPGLNPDQKTRFWRFGKSYHIEKFERKWARYDQAPGFVRAWSFSPASFEIYQQNEKFVWVWVVDPEAATAAAPLPEAAADPMNDATYEFLNRVRPQFTPLQPPSSNKVIRFAESSKGLPTTGSWRNAAAVADMDGDKCLDIVAPPERKGNGTAAIFRGDCKGNWEYWPGSEFPYRLDYGTVAAADFNNDKKMDLAFAVHLSGVFVFLGDGKGKFVDGSNGLPRDFATRRLVAADIDRDGDMDLIATNEGPTDIESFGGSPVRAFVNKGLAKSWQQVAVAIEGVKVGGDWLTAANFNGDQYPDVFVASVYFGTMNVAYLSSGPRTWKAVESDGDLLPSLSYYYANTAGKFTSKNRDDVIISYVRFWPPGASPQRVAPPKLSDVLNLDRLSFEGGKLKRHSIARWVGSGITAMSKGDFDGDGNLDIMYVNDKPRMPVVLLGDGGGGFAAATLEGLQIAEKPIYDLNVADVNRDGKLDVLVMYESAGKSLVDRTGGIQVFLGSGAEVRSTVVAK
jgi:hypothetical protein